VNEMGTPRTALVPKREEISMNLAKLKKGGETFELVLSDPDKALEYRYGLDLDLKDIVQAEKIFKDAKRGEVASEEKMKELFKTSDFNIVARAILQNGEYHLTTEQKRKMTDAKKKQIVQYIHENAGDPKTKLPHPIQRIELAWDQAKVKIDPHVSAKDQIEKVVRALQPILPISFEYAKIRVTIPARFSKSAYSHLKSRYQLKNDVWHTDGSVTFELEAPAKIKADAYSKINQLTNGEAQIEELK